MRRGIASLICFFAHCESSVDWRRLTGRHPAPHSMFFLFYVLYFLCGCIVSLNPEITCIRRCGRAGGVTSTEQTTILPTSTSGLFLLRHIKAAHLFGLFYLCRQNVTHSVCCRKSIWWPFPIQGSPATAHNHPSGACAEPAHFFHAQHPLTTRGGDYENA